MVQMKRESWHKGKKNGFCLGGYYRLETGGGMEGERKTGLGEKGKVSPRETRMRKLNRKKK